MQRFAVMALACAMAAAGCGNAEVLHDIAGRIDMNRLAALR